MKVRCSSCGKVVPYHGDICPYCKADKAIPKRKLQLAGKIAACVAGVGFIVCMVVWQSVVGALFGAFLLAFVGIIVGVAVAEIKSKSW